MKRFATLVAAALVAVPIAMSATASPAAAPTTIKPLGPPPQCTAKAFRVFSQAVWRLGAWERGKPPAKVIQAQRRLLACANAAHRKAMKRTWRKDKAAFYAHRSYKLRWGDCSHSGPVPDCIHGAALTYGADESWMLNVSMCESRWDRFAANPSGATGLFQFLPSTWATTPYGGRSIYSVKWQSLAGAWMQINGRSGEWVCQG